VPDSRAALVSPFFAHPVLCRPPDAPSPLLASTTSSADRHRLPDPSVNWVDAAARDSAASSPEREGDRWLPAYTGGPSEPTRADRGGDVSRAFRPTGRIRPPARGSHPTRGDESGRRRRRSGPPRQTTGPAFARITANRVRTNQGGSDGRRWIAGRRQRSRVRAGETPLAAIAVLSRTRSKDRAKRARRSKTTSRRGVSPLPTLRAVYLTDMMSVWQMSADI